MDEDGERYVEFNEDEIISALHSLRDEVPIDRIQVIDDAVVVIQILWGAVRAQLGESRS